MPRPELNSEAQVENWLALLGAGLKTPGELVLSGPGGLLWHAYQRSVVEPLPSNGMDIVPISDSEEVAGFCYEAHIGSEFERVHGFHINLMPGAALEGLPVDWKERQSSKTHNLLTVHVPAPDDLLIPKIKRGERRDLTQARSAFALGICNTPPPFETP